MQPTVLIDTDILIDMARGIQPMIELVERLENEGMVGISVISQMELIVGCRDKRQLKSLARLVRRFEVVSLTPGVAETAVDLLQRYRLSHGLLMPDALIAATALAEHIPFLTRNQRDYRFIERLELLPSRKATRDFLGEEDEEDEPG